MRVFGLTGGIASGKSTVASMFQEFGVDTIDADRIAKEVLQPGQPIYHKVMDEFGTGILLQPSKDSNPYQPIDSKVLADLIFTNPKARNRLESIVHPAIVARSQEQIRCLQQQGSSFVLYEATLLCETGRYRQFDGLIVVDLPEDIQMSRAIARGLSRTETLERIRAQASRSTRISAATWVIDNSKSLEETRKQVHVLFQSWKDG